ncbi:hypothetical protein FGB62_120g19 [Gracilaria domingensis]|nr:hypothetical protein FGB62_120g19 [Gracilaria domingensis]
MNTTVGVATDSKLGLASNGHRKSHCWQRKPLSRHQRIPEEVYTRLQANRLRSDPDFRSNAPERTGLAVFAHYKNVKREVLKFEGCHTKVMAAVRTGKPTENDIIRATTAIYSGCVSIVDIYRALDRATGVQIGPCLKYIAVWQWMGNSKLLSDIGRAKSTSPIAQNRNTLEGSSSKGGRGTSHAQGKHGTVGSESAGAEGGVAEQATGSANEEKDLLHGVKQPEPLNEKTIRKGDIRPMGRKKAKFEAMLVPCLDEAARGIKRLGETSIESNKLKKMHLYTLRETSDKKQRYIELKCAQEEERHHLQLFIMDISPHLKELILQDMERKLTECFANSGEKNGEASENEFEAETKTKKLDITSLID